MRNFYITHQPSSRRKPGTIEASPRRQWRLHCTNLGGPGFCRDDDLEKPRRQTGTEGFTLTELLVVLGIIALLAALVAPQVVRYLSKARTDTANAQIKNIEGALELYYLDVGSYPPANDGLEALFTAPANVLSWKGPYLKQRDGLADPWGRPYLYQSPSQHGDFDISSLGRDGREGGKGEDADVTSW